MTKAVVCRSIDGYEQYEPLVPPAQTADEKLLVYYRPLGYKMVLKDGQYSLHLTQDGQIRRKGQKAVLLRKQKLLDYEPREPSPLGPRYLRNSVSLKGLPPGEYEFDIILHDQNEPGPPAVQTVAFSVVPARLPDAGKDEEPK